MEKKIWRESESGETLHEVNNSKMLFMIHCYCMYMAANGSMFNCKCHHVVVYCLQSTVTVCTWQLMESN